MSDGDDFSQAFADGREPEAFWAQLDRTLRPMIRARLPAGSPEVNDVLAEVFVGLLEIRARGRFDPEKGILPLARTVAERRCVDRLRRMYRRPEESLDSLTEPDELTRRGPARQFADPRVDVEREALDDLERVDQRKRFRAAFDEMRRRDRRHGSIRAAAVFLRYQAAIQSDDYGFLGPGELAAAPSVTSWSEVADLLQLTAAAARQNGFRGLKLLKELWKAEQSPEAGR